MKGALKSVRRPRISAVASHNPGSSAISSETGRLSTYYSHMRRCSSRGSAGMNGATREASRSYRAVAPTRVPLTSWGKLD